MKYEIDLRDDISTILENIYQTVKKHNPLLNKDNFFNILIKQWLETYEIPKENKWDSLSKEKFTLKNDLKYAIQSSNKSQAKIAKEINISQTYLSQIISGKYEPSIKIVLLLLKAINYPASKIEKIFSLEPLP